MKTFFYKLFIFLGLLSLVLLGLEKYYDHYFTQHIDACNKPLWILKQKNQEYDFAAIGSSRVFNMLDIVTLEKSTQLKGINLAASGSGFAENYLLLKQFSKNNSIRTLIVQVDLYSLDAKNAFGYPFHDYLYLNKMNEPDVDSIYRDNVKPSKYYMWKYIPFSKYMEFSNFFSLYKVLKGGYECSSSFLDTTGGSFLVNGSEAEEKEVKADKNATFKKRFIEQKDLNYLLKIISFAQSKKIKLLFYTAPEYAKSFALQGNREAIFTTISALAQQNSIPYYNFDVASVALCQDFTNFKDNTHLNKKGSLLFSQQFGDSLNTILSKQ